MRDLILIDGSSNLSSLLLDIPGGLGSFALPVYGLCKYFKGKGEFLWVREEDQFEKSDSDLFC